MSSFEVIEISLSFWIAWEGLCWKLTDNYRFLEFL